MLLIDLDRFKEVNDTLGHDYGDALLIEVAERLGSALRRGDTLARLGGDEFAVLVAGAPDREAVIDVATRLQDALRRPFALRGVAVELEASIGVALYPEHGTNVGRLLQRADVAMYEAKRGRLGVATYTAERDPYSADRLGLLAELRSAIDRSTRSRSTARSWPGWPTTRTTRSSCARRSTSPATSACAWWRRAWRPRRSWTSSHV